MGSSQAVLWIQLNFSSAPEVYMIKHMPSSSDSAFSASAHQPDHLKTPPSPKLTSVVACALSYTSGAEEKLSCIQRTACEDPKTASEYATAAKMVYKVHKMVGLNF